MVLIQCFGCADLAKRRAALNGHIHVPFDAQLALVVECVATALDEQWLHNPNFQNPNFSAQSEFFWKKWCLLRKSVFTLGARSLWC